MLMGLYRACFGTHGIKGVWGFQGFLAASFCRGDPKK